MIEDGVKVCGCGGGGEHGLEDEELFVGNLNWLVERKDCWFGSLLLLNSTGILTNLARWGCCESGTCLFSFVIHLVFSCNKRGEKIYMQNND